MGDRAKRRAATSTPMSYLRQRIGTSLHGLRLEAGNRRLPARLQHNGKWNPHYCFINGHNVELQSLNYTGAILASVAMTLRESNRLG
jgi:hypothetical protein